MNLQHCVLAAVMLLDITRPSSSGQPKQHSFTQQLRALLDTDTTPESHKG